MKSVIQGETHVLALEIGEELIESILIYAEKSKISAASIQAIGAIRNFQLGYYVLNEKKYLRKKVEEIAELISCSGNLAMKDDKPVVHVHVSAGLPDFSVIGGHLFSAIVAVTAEVILAPLPKRMNRTFNDETGLYLLGLIPWKAS
jgi:predicted DNA-binding protein with PD1-like motif